MSTHPNVILMAVLKSDDLPMKTLRAIRAGDDEIRLGDRCIHSFVAESDWEADYQISSEEGDLIFFDFVTYGYGEKIEWSKLEEIKSEFEKWVVNVCDKYHCSYQIFISANYW